MMTGGNLIHDCGFMDIGMTGSVDHLVLYDEIISMANGAKDTAQRVHKKLTDILETHKVEPLKDEVTAEIDGIIAAAEKRVGSFQKFPYKIHAL